MAKLRKMLGDVNEPVIVSLMRLIETQSIKTLAGWAIDYAENNFLSIYMKEYPDVSGIRNVIAAAREYLDGIRKLKEVKPYLKEVNQIAKESVARPAAQAAARAIATACATIQTPTNALGFTFYGAAALVYDRAGLSESQEVYDVLATAELENMLAALEKAAVKDEENPVKINWYC